MPALFIANYYPPFQSVAFFLSQPGDGVILDEAVDKAYIQYLQENFQERELFFVPELMTRASLRDLVPYQNFSEIIPCIASQATDDLSRFSSGTNGRTSKSLRIRKDKQKR